MTEQTTQNEAPPPPPGLPLAQAIGTRNLLIIIVTMPLVFVLVVVATLSVFGRPGAGRERAAATTPVATLEQPAARVTLPLAANAGAPAPLILPRGGALGAMALDGDRLALRIDTPEGGQIVIYDVVRGVEIQRIEIAEAGKRGDL